MKPAGRSLLDFLATPIVVADPDGRTVHANPEFLSRFRHENEDAFGQPLADLFAGGARESVLAAVARSCESGRSVRFVLRDGGRGYEALASPLSVEDGRVGVILLLMESSLDTERLLAFHREVASLLDVLEASLSELIEQTGGRRHERHREQVEGALRAVARLRKWSDELRGAAAGEPAPPGAQRFDPAAAARAAVAGLPVWLDPAERIEVQLPAELPEVCGEPERFEAALAALLRERLERGPSVRICLSGRAAERGRARSVLIALRESPAAQAPGSGPGDPEASGSTLPEPAARILESMGAAIHVTDDPLFGSVTTIRLPAAA